MTNPSTNPLVDAFISDQKKWREELAKLREIILDCPLTEELKWGKPCYSFEGKNVVLIHGFKEYCAILFIKGALLQDPHEILVQQTENVQAGRQIRFTSIEEITGMETAIKEYIHQAIGVEKAGLEIKFKTEYTVPAEFQTKLDEMPALKTAFEALTPGRQRAYLLYFSAPKQAVTRASRVDKYLQKILDGKGLDD